MKKNQPRKQPKPAKNLTKPRQTRAVTSSNQRPKLQNTSKPVLTKDGLEHNLGVHGNPFMHIANRANHIRHAHKKHQHDHFREDLNEAIRNFESSKESYANALLYPEVSMARIPFICPVPTALARGVSIYTFTPDTSVGDTFMWSFIPEAISGQQDHFPFYYGSSASNVDSADISSTYLTRSTLFPNIQFSSIDAMRIVGASITVTQTQRLVDRAGYGVQSRVYGLGAAANIVSKTAVINSTYKDEANYSSTGEEDHLRMVYAPADFSDLHMKVVDEPDTDNEKYPVIQGFITGYGTAVTALTFEFNVTIEYIPKPILYQMVERKVATVSPGSLAKAENVIARPDMGVQPEQLSLMQQLRDLNPTELRTVGQTLKRTNPQESNSFMSYLRSFGRTSMNLMPLIANAARTIAPLVFSKHTLYPIKINEIDQRTKPEEPKKEYLVRRIDLPR